MNRLATLLCLFLGLIATNAAGSGFGVFTQGARGMGQANAVVAHPVGPSSLYFNPALLPEISGTQLEAGTTLVVTDRTFSPTSANGQSSDSEEPNHFPSSFYLTHSYANGIATGLGVNFPFGLSTEWSDSWDGRFIATKSKVFTSNINPVVAWQSTPRLALAAGLDLMYLDAELQRRINTTAVGFIANPPGGLGPLGEINQKFTGNDWGVGYNLGLHLKLMDNLAFGAIYRSKVDMTVTGTTGFNIPADAAAFGLDAFFPNTGGKADITLPAQAAFGLAWTATDKLTLEAGARWENWSAFNELRIKFDQPVLNQTEFTTPRDWDDTWAFNIGGEYQLNETITLLAGYLYGDNPVPDSTFDPSIPDADSQVMTLGTLISSGSWDLALAYGYEHHKDRSKNNAIADPLDPGAATYPASAASGVYSADSHLFALSVGYRF
jgi:long-chain fatty acid transport protein